MQNMFICDNFHHFVVRASLNTYAMDTWISMHDLKKLRQQQNTRKKPMKTHQCDICGVSFGYSSLLQQHVKSIHEGVKDHNCVKCGKLFTALSNLKVHIKNVHEKKKYQCILCDLQFLFPGELKNHVRTIHEETKDHKCAKNAH